MDEIKKREKKERNKGLRGGMFSKEQETTKKVKQGKTMYGK